MAETIVRELFKELGFTKIYRFGMEHSMQAILGELDEMEDPVSLMVRRMPDFVMIDRDETNKKSYFLEVKYRKNGGYPVNKKDKKELENNPYEDAVIVLLTEKHILAKTVKECQKSGFGKDWLSTCSAFNFTKEDKNTIIKFKKKLKCFKGFENLEAE